MLSTAVFPIRTCSPLNQAFFRSKCTAILSLERITWTKKIRIYVKSNNYWSRTKFQIPMSSRLILYQIKVRAKHKNQILIILEACLNLKNQATSRRKFNRGNLFQTAIKQKLTRYRYSTICSVKNPRLRIS